MLERYGHGGDLLTAAETYGKNKEAFLDFSSNMNPLGPPQAVETILRERWRDLSVYPDPAVRELRSKLASKYGVPMESILVGNGAAELIDLAVRVLQPGITALARPSFSEYEEAVEKTGGSFYDIQLHAENGFLLREDDLRRAAAASDLLFLGSPNNPTGRLLPDPILRILADLGKPVILDEAFIDFHPREGQISLIRQAAESANLMVIRSMTKFYSIPGLRLGFIVANPERIRQMQRLQVPWSVNTLAQLIGAAVLDDSDYERRTMAWLAEERPWLKERLKELGLSVTPSDTNYVLFSLKRLGIKVTDLQGEMGRRGILIRDASRFPGLDDSYVRIAIRLREHNERLLGELRQALDALSVKRTRAERVFLSAADDFGLPDGLSAHRSQIQPAKSDFGSLTEEASATGDAAMAAHSSSEPMVEPDAELFNPSFEAPSEPGWEARFEQPPAERGVSSKASTLMVQGTSSDAGKSLLVTALCRIFWQDGLRVAPFKSQNMSLNSYVTPDGREIGRAQGMQADACRIAATTDMNPILLKPKKDMVSQVVVHGKPLRDLDARTYRENYLSEAEAIVREALSRLRESFQAVVIEGAGSPAEVNLKDRDIVNMRLAGWADAPVVLVADIDRGGVFASLVGTLDIFTPLERDRVKGFIINKFRGDVTLLQPGLEWLERRTGKPVLGVVPFLPNLELEDEDSASLDRKLAKGALNGGGPVIGTKTGSALSGDREKLDIAVIRLPRLSNFTDVDPLAYENDVRLRFVTSVEDLGCPDAIILPGSKNTVDDLAFMRETGLVQALLAHVRRNGWVAGICAGYQMMGERLLDPLQVESDRPLTAGLGLFPTETVFSAEKRTVLAEGVTSLYNGFQHQEYPAEAEIASSEDGQAASSGQAAPSEMHSAFPITGYEIHMGQTTFLQPVRHPFHIKEAGSDQPARPDGVVTENGRLWGTYVHGILHNDDFRRAWLNAIRRGRGWEPLVADLRFQDRREAAFDRLADHVRHHLDMKRIYEIIGVAGKEA